MRRLTEHSDDTYVLDSTVDRRFAWVVGSALVLNAFMVPALFLFTMYGLMFLPLVVTLGLTIVAFVMIRERCMSVWKKESKPWLLLSGTIGMGMLFVYDLAIIAVISASM